MKIKLNIDILSKGKDKDKRISETRHLQSLKYNKILRLKIKHE